ncbi:MAG: hypothetical protein VW239_00370 [Candidatus Nanopelagicales bacterium]
MIFLGIDPGASGGIAWLSSFSEEARAHKFPDTERDAYEVFLMALADAGRNNLSTFAIIERVHSMPKQGVVSSFKFGQSYGFLRGCLIALEIPFEEATPQSWQKAIGCLSRGDKNVTKAKAQQLFPGRRITHATADALLLAEYARRTWTARNVAGGAA